MRYNIPEIHIVTLISRSLAVYQKMKKLSPEGVKIGQGRIALIVFFYSHFNKNNFAILMNAIDCHFLTTSDFNLIFFIVLKEIARR